jgi:glycosyltransferase involved in cell wall biosynthesis
MGSRARPSVSAIIPAYNAERYVGAAIDSVLGQTYPVGECLVVDDGSTDGTADVTERFGGVVSVIRQENRGVSAARNRAVAEAHGDLLAFLDADDRWLPTRVARGVGVLRDDPRLEAVVCATEVVDRELGAVGVIRQDPDLSPEDLLMCRGSVVSASSNLLIRREVFAELGGFDEELSTSADWALTFRLVERGRLGVLKEPLVQYRRHESNMSASVPRFERDMLAAFGSVFADTSSRLQPLRRRAYANLHRMIAGSYFVDGRFRAFARHAARSVSGHPSTLPYFLGMPLRRLRRKRTGEVDPLAMPQGRALLPPPGFRRD